MRNVRLPVAAVILGLATSVALAGGSTTQDRQAPAGTPIAATPTARPTDPVCGMQVEPKRELSSTHDGTRYYFCSVGDKTKFDNAPEKYVRKQPK